MNEIPLVSKKDLDANGPRKDRFVRALGDALRTFGFVRVTDHGIRASWLDSLHASAGKLFALPPGELMRYHRPDIYCQRGYVPFRQETAAGYNVADEKACWHYGRDSVMPNNWPPDDIIPGLRLDCARLFTQLDLLYIDLMVAVEQYLGLPENFLSKMVRGGNNSLMRVAFYPRFKGDEPSGALRSKEHKDINMLTLLPTASASGLEVMTRDGVWIPIKALPGEIIVSVSLMLERVTNGFLSAALHRVVNPNGKDIPNVDRVSVPFFGHPVGSAILEVPAKFTGEGFPKPKPTVTALEALQEVLREIKLAV